VEVLILLLFISLVFVVLAVGLYAWTLRQRSHEHCDRLSLLPLDLQGTDPWKK
jgi:Flp pilus assembly protein TadB